MYYPSCSHISNAEATPLQGNSALEPLLQMNSVLSLVCDLALGSLHSSSRWISTQYKYWPYHWLCTGFNPSSWFFKSHESHIVFPILLLFEHACKEFITQLYCFVFTMSQLKPIGVNSALATPLHIKQVQEEALRGLPLRRLYIILFIRNYPPIANDFHWGFYYHKTIVGGTKYHIKNIHTGWIADHEPTGGVFKSLFLCVLIEIGSIPADKEEKLDQIMKSLDKSLKDISGITCRVWIFTILPLLIQAGLLRCNDLESLQQECFNWGNAYMDSAASNDQPRPVRVSSQCF